MARGVGNNSADGSHSSAGKTPRTKRSVKFAHVMMEQNISRTGGSRSHKRAYYAACRHGGLERLGFEPLVEKIGRTHRHQLGKIIEEFSAKAAEMIPQHRQAKEVLRIP